MKWNKLGLVFKAEGQFGWMNSHTQVPTLLEIPERNLLRIYFSTRPRPGLSLTGFLDVDANDPQRVVYVHDRPVLEPGPIGAFDEHGVMAQWCVRRDETVFLYYLGWSRRIDIPYSNWIGLAISEDGGITFRKAFPGPILDRTRDEIFSGTGLFALPEGAGYRGWYVKGLGWTDIGGRLEERYLITETTSENGLDWTRGGDIVVAPAHDQEAMTRPVVLKIGDRWHMWYCKRSLIDFRDGSGAYRIGYAVSEDGRSWVRKDESVGIAPSVSGWDSTMQTYPYAKRHGDRLFLFYCGNGFGAGGFGVAEASVTPIDDTL